MKTLQLVTLVTLAAAFTGCATVAPPELVNARSAYQQASEGPAQQLAPAELHKAHEALTMAEQSFKKDADSYKTKDLAYVAQRKSEQAGALGSIKADKANKDSANADYQAKQAELVEQGKQDLSDSQNRTAAAHAELVRQAEIKAAQEKADADSRMQQAAIAQGEKDLRDAENQAAATQAELVKQAELQTAKDKAAADSQLQQAAIAQGQKDLKDSELRTATALAELATIASLKEEERGLVLTLSGSILFRSSESTLMAPARVKLDQVAKALQAIRTRNLIVEGHTDSMGTRNYNQGLSQRRANAVRDYLVQSGYPADHIQSRGRGEDNPIGVNATPEGRANNRRVEIVIEREPVTKK
ncbi:MAG: OmpA family protein [Desulfuromonadaceae bacterium]|nr:OmpA family protein [Desulfuromonadaceae bacterium]MDD2848303.1 OmpA family protein [Desulfuromonadaceae bacterium]MDD4129301.1 OmpA family protein [Desulfuromonadaceae bacterium]